MYFLPHNSHSPALGNSNLRGFVSNMLVTYLTQAAQILMRHKLRDKPLASRISYMMYMMYIVIYYMCKMKYSCEISFLGSKIVQRSFNLHYFFCGGRGVRVRIVAQAYSYTTR
jgi:hypothetical protein